eukprot:s492_g19.t3
MDCEERQIQNASRRFSGELDKRLCTKLLLLAARLRPRQSWRWTRKVGKWKPQKDVQRWMLRRMRSNGAQNMGAYTKSGCGINRWRSCAREPEMARWWKHRKQIPSSKLQSRDPLATSPWRPQYPGSDGAVNFLRLCHPGSLAPRWKRIDRSRDPRTLQFNVGRAGPHMPVTRVHPINASEPLEIKTLPGSTVADLKEGLRARTGIRVSAQRLVAGGRLLQEDALVESLTGRIFLAQTSDAANSTQDAAGSVPAPDASEMKLLIRAVWSDGRQEDRTVEVKAQLAASDFKQKVLASLGEDFSAGGRCSFVFAGQLLSSEGTLEDQGFEEGDTIVVVAPRVPATCLQCFWLRMVWLLRGLRAFALGLWMLPWTLGTGLRTAWYDPWSIVRPSVPEEARRGPRIRTLGFTPQMARYGPGQNPRGEDLTMVLTQGLVGMKHGGKERRRLMSTTGLETRALVLPLMTARPSFSAGLVVVAVATVIGADAHGDGSASMSCGHIRNFYQAQDCCSEGEEPLSVDFSTSEGTSFSSSVCGASSPVGVCHCAGAMQLLSQVPGVQAGNTNFPHGNIKVLATAGEVDPLTGSMLTGVPDGLGAYLKDADTVRLIYQSEAYGQLVSSNPESFPWTVNSNTASFTHFIDYDRSRLATFMDDGAPAKAQGMVKGAGNAATRSNVHESNVDVYGNYIVGSTAKAPSKADWLMQSLCSAHLEVRHQWGNGKGVEDDLFITNEEWISYPESSLPIGLPVHVLNLGSRELWATAAFTLGGHEKVVEVNSGHQDYVAFVPSGYNGAFGISRGTVDCMVTASRDAWHKTASAGDTVRGAFYKLRWQAQRGGAGFEHDGSWEFQDAAKGALAGWCFWNSNGKSRGAKTEHVSPDPRGGHRVLQGSTAGYFGIYDFSSLPSLLGSSFPDSVPATYTVYQPESDVRSLIELGGAGIRADGNNQKMMRDTSRDKSTFEDVDGMEWIAAANGQDYFIIHEDGGNWYGERKFLAQVGISMRYYFVAQSGGRANTRELAGVSSVAGVNGGAGSHEFSGALDLSGLLRKDASGNFELPVKDVTGKKRQLEAATPIEKTIAVCKPTATGPPDLLSPSAFARVAYRPRVP